MRWQAAKRALQFIMHVEVQVNPAASAGSLVSRFNRSAISRNALRSLAESEGQVCLLLLKPVGTNAVQPDDVAVNWWI